MMAVRIYKTPSHSSLYSLLLSFRPLCHLADCPSRDLTLAALPWDASLDLTVTIFNPFPSNGASLCPISARIMKFTLA